MATDKKNTNNAPETGKTKKTPVSATINRNKHFSDREHGRTHDSPKSKVDPKTL